MDGLTQILCSLTTPKCPHVRQEFYLKYRHKNLQAYHWFPYFYFLFPSPIFHYFFISLVSKIFPTLFSITFLYSNLSHPVASLSLLSPPLPISYHQRGHSYNTFVQPENPLQKDAAWENWAATIWFPSLTSSLKMSATQGRISSMRFSLLQIQPLIPQLDPHGWLCKLKWGLEG